MWSPWMASSHLCHQHQVPRSRENTRVMLEHSSPLNATVHTGVKCGVPRRRGAVRRKTTHLSISLSLSEPETQIIQLPDPFQ